MFKLGNDFTVMNTDKIVRIRRCSMNELEYGDLHQSDFGKEEMDYDYMFVYLAGEHPPFYLSTGCFHAACDRCGINYDDFLSIGNADYVNINYISIIDRIGENKAMFYFSDGSTAVGTNYSRVARDGNAHAVFLEEILEKKRSKEST